MFAKQARNYAENKLSKQRCANKQETTQENMQKSGKKLEKSLQVEQKISRQKSKQEMQRGTRTECIIERVVMNLERRYAKR